MHTQQDILRRRRLSGSWQLWRAGPKEKPSDEKGGKQVDENDEVLGEVGTVRMTVMWLPLAM